MTLDIVKLITNVIKTQAKIHHLDVSTKTVEKVPESVSKLIFDQYGDKYLLDADYVSFFWGDISKDNIEKLFNVVDKALGKSANRLTESDFKRLDVDFKPAASTIASDDDQEEKYDDIDDEDTDDKENDSTTNTSNEENEDDNDDKDTDSNDEDEDKELNEDDETEKEKTVVEPKYYFLKITIK